MKKHVFILLFLILYYISDGQVTGIKSIPGDFPTIEASIAALNSQGVGDGGVTFNVAAAHSETFSVSSAGLITASGSADNPVIFQKSGSGANPLITASTPGVGIMDYIICFSGVDFITFNGIDIHENPANSESLSQMEWGFAVLKSSETSGSQHITVKNSSISLNSSNSASYGVYSNNHTVSSSAQLVISNLSGTNSNNKFFGLTISNAYNAFYFYGRSDGSPFTFYDQDNEIGVGGYNNIYGLGSSSGTVSSYGIYCSNQNGLKIANNTFTGTSSNTSGSLYVIYLLSGSNSNVDVFNNTISMTYLGTGAFYGIFNSGMGTSGTSNTVNYYNNSIINNSLPNYSNNTLAYIYISTGGVTTNLYNNIINGNVAGSAITAANGTIYYIYLSSNSITPGTTNIYQNSITNNSRIQPVPGSGSTFILYTSGNGHVLNEMNNTIDNITISSSGTTYGLYNLYSGAIKNVHDNTVTNIYQANGTVYSIYNGNGSGAGYFFNNKIQNINMVAVSRKLYGIYQSSGVNQFHYNNYISELKAPNAIHNPAIYGIYLAGSTKTGAFNNTVYLNASSSGSTFGVTGIYARTISEVELKNNLIVNNSIPGPLGRVVAYQRSSDLLASYSTASNSNNFYAGTPGPSNLIFFDGGNSDQSLEDYKSRVSPRDANSITEIPPFVNVTNYPFDLHIQSTLPSQCESGGMAILSPINIFDDYDGNPRYPYEGYPENAGAPVNAPDIGADEFGGLVLDLTAPNIAFHPLENTSGTGGRILNGTITDATGVPVSGTGLPVLYWRINNEAYNSAVATWISGDDYSFTFGAGVVPGDVVSYYIVAQDITTPMPNVGANPFGGAGGFSVYPPSCETAPLTPYSYLIVGSLSGTYPVGAGQVYPTLTAAIGDLNMKEVIAPVTFELWDASYSASETFPLIIHSYPGMSPEKPVTIKPREGVVATISGASSTGILTLYGADNVIITGADSGSTNRNLIFENTSNLGETYVLGLFHNGLKGAQNNSILNCVVKAGSKITNTWAILLNAQGGDYDNTVIRSNLLLNAMTGIQFAGLPIGITDNGLIAQNTFGDNNNALTLGNVGINVSHVDGLSISGNHIRNLFTNSNPKGINIGINTVNTTISGNTITGIKYAGTSGYGGKGIDVNTGSLNSNLTIANNSISQIMGDGSSTVSSNAIVGIRLLGTSGGINIFFNSVNLSGTLNRSGAFADVSAAFYAAATITDLDIRNNIFYNNLNNISGNSKAYAFYSDAPAEAYTKINYNDYFGGGPEGVLGYMGTVRTNLASWQTATLQDGGSINQDPWFASATDLHPANPGIDNKGYYLMFLPKDIDGIARTNPPDMGSFEFGTNPDVISLDPTGVNCENGTLNGTINANGLMVNTYFDYGPDASYGNSVPGNPAMVEGLELTPISVTISMAPATTYHFRSRAVTSDGVIVYGNDMTVISPDSGPPLAITHAATNIDVSEATLNGLVTANCNLTNVTFEYGLTDSYGFQISALEGPVNGGMALPVSADISDLGVNTLYHFRCVGQSEAGIHYGDDQVFSTLTPPPSGAGDINGPTSVCQATSGHIYAISPIEFADQYIWTVPPGATITSGENTESITVSYDYTAISGSVTVYGSGVGGNGSASELYVTVYPLPVPVISGTDTACISSVYVYSTEEGMSDYIWTVSPGGQVISGDGTSAISIQWNSIGAQFVTVTYSSAYGCPAASPVYFDVSVNSLPTPSIIGSNVTCANSGLYVYTTQMDYNNYVWTVPSGGTIVSGQGTYQIEVNWNEGGNHNVMVNYQNASNCFASEPFVFGVTILQVPGVAGEISGTSELCAGARSVNYSVAPISDALEYIWDLPAGAIIVSGEFTNSIKVDFEEDAISGTIIVHGENNCGEGISSPPFEVMVNPLPPIPEASMEEGFILHSSIQEGNQWFLNGILIPGANEQDYLTEETGVYWTVVTLNGCSSMESNHIEVIFTGLPELADNNFIVFPVPNDGKFTVSINIPDEDNFTILVYNGLGIKVYESRDFRVKGKAQFSIELNNPTAGIYTTILQGKDRTIIKKVLVAQ